MELEKLYYISLWKLQISCPSLSEEREMETGKTVLYLIREITDIMSVTVIRKRDGIGKTVLYIIMEIKEYHVHHCHKKERWNWKTGTISHSMYYFLICPYTRYAMIGK